MKSANIWYGNEISHEDIVNNQENLTIAIAPTNGWDFSNIENNILTDLYGENNGTVEGATIENYL